MDLLAHLGDVPLRAVAAIFATSAFAAFTHAAVSLFLTAESESGEARLDWTPDASPLNSTTPDQRISNYEKRI